VVRAKAAADRRAAEAIDAARASGKLQVESVPEIGLEVPRDKQHGDFASNIALVMARSPARRPEVAEIIVEHLPQGGVIRAVEVPAPVSSISF